MTDQRKERGRKDSEGRAISQAKPRSPWQEPKLEFVEPTLVKHGDMKQITAGFIGTFVPED